MAAPFNVATDFHSYRFSVVHELFRFHPEITSYLKAKYEDILEGPRETVSVHFRFDGFKEPDRKRLSRMPQPDALWYLSVIERFFDPSQSVFLFFSEDSRQLESLLLRLVIAYSDFKFIIVNENYALSLALMSMCKHHIVATSMFSFWGLQFRILLTLYSKRMQVHIWIRSSHQEDGLLCLLTLRRHSSRISFHFQHGSQTLTR
jgi:hypothetical protein